MPAGRARRGRRAGRCVPGRLCPAHGPRGARRRGRPRRARWPRRRGCRSRRAARTARRHGARARAGAGRRRCPRPGAGRSGTDAPSALVEARRAVRASARARTGAGTGRPRAGPAAGPSRSTRGPRSNAGSVCRGPGRMRPWRPASRAGPRGRPCPGRRRRSSSRRLGRPSGPPDAAGPPRSCATCAHCCVVRGAGARRMPRSGRHRRGGTARACSHCATLARRSEHTTGTGTQ